MNKVKKPRWQKGLSGIFVLSGLMLLVYMITMEDEPGLVPLALILTGLAGYTLYSFKESK